MIQLLKQHVQLDNDPVAEAAIEEHVQLDNDPVAEATCSVRQ